MQLTIPNVTVKELLKAYKITSIYFEPNARIYYLYLRA